MLAKELSYTSRSFSMETSKSIERLSLRTPLAFDSGLALPERAAPIAAIAFTSFLGLMERWRFLRYSCRRRRMRACSDVANEAIALGDRGMPLDGDCACGCACPGICPPPPAAFEPVGDVARPFDLLSGLGVDARLRFGELPKNGCRLCSVRPVVVACRQRERPNLNTSNPDVIYSASMIALNYLLYSTFTCKLTNISVTCNFTDYTLQTTVHYLYSIVYDILYIVSLELYANRGIGTVP